MPSVNLMWDTGDATITVDNGNPIQVTGATEKLLNIAAGQHVIKIDFANGASIERTVVVPDVVSAAEVATIIASKQGYIDLVRVDDDRHQVMFKGAKAGVNKVRLYDVNGDVVHTWSGLDPEQPFGNLGFSDDAYILDKIKAFDTDDNLIDEVDINFAAGINAPFKVVSVLDNRQEVKVVPITEGLKNLKNHVRKADNSGYGQTTTVNNPVVGTEYTFTCESDEKIDEIEVKLYDGVFVPVYKVLFSDPIAGGGGGGAQQTIQCWQRSTDGVTTQTMTKAGVDDSWFAEFKYGSVHPSFTAELPAGSKFEVSVSASPYIGDDNCDLARINVKTDQVASIEEGQVYVEEVLVKDPDGNEVDRVPIVLHIITYRDSKYYFHARGESAYVQYNGGVETQVNGGDIMTYNKYQSSDHSFLNGWILPVPYCTVKGNNSYNVQVFWSNSFLLQSDKATVTSSAISNNVEFKIALLDEASGSIVDSGWFNPGDASNCKTLSVANGTVDATIKTVVLQVRAKNDDANNIPANTLYLGLKNLGCFITKVG